MSEHPRIAVVGCGYWGSKHVRVIHDNRSARLALAVDSRQERLEYIASMYPGVATSTDLDAVLEDGIDAVVLATPISSHYALARRVLLAGKHVLVEKPLATSVAECRELIALAERQGLTLMVGHTFEYHPAVVYLREMVRSGELGDIYYIDCARLNLGLFQRDSDVLWDLAPHDFSIVYSILDRPARAVSARGSSHILPNTVDVAFATMRFDDAISANVHVSWLDPCKVRRVTVVGSKAMVVFNDVALTEKVRIYDKRFTYASTGDRYSDYQSGYHNGNVIIPPISGAEPLGLEIEDFVRGIATGEQVRANGYSGLRVVETLETASRSLAAEGQVETIGAVARNQATSVPPAGLFEGGARVIPRLAAS